jgi:hypothetical protein
MDLKDPGLRIEAEVSTVHGQGVKLINKGREFRAYALKGWGSEVTPWGYGFGMTVGSLVHRTVPSNNLRFKIQATTVIQTRRPPPLALSAPPCHTPLTLSLAWTSAFAATSALITES